MLLALILAAAAPEGDFPEQVPGMVEACLMAAIADEAVTEEAENHKYICTDAPARDLWDYLERTKVESWEQDTPAEGRWLSRAFPMGACFKQLVDEHGKPATDGLSCSVWVPRPPAEGQR
jgi:hypothetical protein